MNNEEKNEYNIDDCGRRTDCVFLRRTRKGMSCSALIDFYSEVEYARCYKCPFFKTEEEFKQGNKAMQSRRGRIYII